MEPEVEETFSGREISFKVKKTMMGRIGKDGDDDCDDGDDGGEKNFNFIVDHVDRTLSGWRIMPEDDSLNLKMNKDILNQVLESIK